MITYNSIGKYGRFGNQMFQYSTLFAIAKERGYEFGVPHQLKSDNEYLNFCLLECFSNLSAKDMDAVDRLSKGIIAKLLHGPMTHLRQQNEGDATRAAIQQVQQAFQLE